MVGQPWKIVIQRPLVIGSHAPDAVIEVITVFVLKRLEGSRVTFLMVGIFHDTQLEIKKDMPP